MKKLLVIGLIALIAVGCNQSPPGPAKKYIEWGSDNEIADAMAMKGLFHFVNIEREMAYTYFKGSLDHDSTLFGSHVILAWLTPQGDEREMHKDKARELVKNKNETSKRMWGTTRSLINSAVIGVATGFEKILELNGVGFRAMLKGDVINFQLGFCID